MKKEKAIDYSDSIARFENLHGRATKAFKSLVEARNLRFCVTEGCLDAVL